MCIGCSSAILPWCSVEDTKWGHVTQHGCPGFYYQLQFPLQQVLEMDFRVGQFTDTIQHCTFSPSYSNDNNNNNNN